MEKRFEFILYEEQSKELRIFDLESRAHSSSTLGGLLFEKDVTFFLCDTTEWN